MKKFLILPALSLVFITTPSSCFKDKGPSCINNTLERDKQVRLKIFSFVYFLCF